MNRLFDVTAVEVIAEFRLRLAFTDGTVGDVDFSERVWHGVFAPLRDPQFFAQVRLDRDAGTMAPEPLYEQARRHPAGLGSTAG